ncbi:MAG: DUF86 domain-containing protein [Okeania sp. SIO1H6]|uniref:DUF86 domain-containing protein n=1 Tax=Okeania hirsuta TaxID=1458930 RepID=A0A3N6PG71_9CYAN|nr:DUF86 domain-containing protein [Okeania sp. SIO1H4]NES91791.1 DUF86 domain-containing protein [Okeania sp. SIO2B9]NET12100.1 DUF86 domain-containing protein [Okeania sp. SIO1H6]NET19292.1 DUF86 domain-containing protein [Okeania sp. SIO1H5]NET75907.1 DUF86 domain-containing protein [Okeania sp. SIO1F9]NET92887.1 DUF86 domain-containing protein [Okeania sp. SIO1H2]RQH26244.1 DUF86 domain-containing protein [Okeania hirsuta]
MIIKSQKISKIINYKYLNYIFSVSLYIAITKIISWAEVYLPGAGWVVLDITSGFLTAENHIPLVCTPEPTAANPVRGTTEPSESNLEFSVTVSRYQEKPRPTKPYTETQWQKINTLGRQVEEKLRRLGLGLTTGGEPTFISIDDFESPQWRVEAFIQWRQIAGFRDVLVHNYLNINLNRVWGV